MAQISYTRKLIEIEVKLGFLFIPAKAQAFLPNKNSKVKVIFSDEDEEGRFLSYNSEYNRIFGLTSWYKQHKLTAGSYLKIEIENNIVTITNKTVWLNELRKKGKIVTQELDNELTHLDSPSLDISNLSTQVKGNIIEDRVKEIILLYGQSLLNIYKPVIDNEGIDLLVMKNGFYHPIFLQVKSRYNAVEEVNLVLTLSRTFKPHMNFHIVGIAFNTNSLELEDRILFIPSEVISKEAIHLKNGTIRITASLNKSSRDKWQKYMVSKEELVSKLIEQFTEMEKYYK